MAGELGAATASRQEEGKVKPQKGEADPAIVPRLVLITIRLSPPPRLLRHSPPSCLRLVTRESKREIERGFGIPRSFVRRHLRGAQVGRQRPAVSEDSESADSIKPWPVRPPDSEQALHNFRHVLSCTELNQASSNVIFGG
ncbi:unnamed protein product [Victoria cruziana]